MPDLTQALAAYVPQRIVRAALQGAQPPAQARAERFLSAVLFADISGFTPLTEALAARGAEGTEELTQLLNDYFWHMIALIEAQGGEVVKFSGDALTALFSAEREGLGTAARRAQQAAQDMQSATGGTPCNDAIHSGMTLQTSIGPVELAMKIGIGAGEILALHVGGISGRWEYVVAGDPLRQVTQAEKQAERGQVILSPEAQAVVLAHPVSPGPTPPLDWSQARDLQAVAAVLRCYVPTVVVDWLEGGLQEWLAVLRPMVVLFVGVSGIDYTKDSAKAIAQLHTFLRTAQKTIDRYQGSINKLAVDDKGTVLLALLGAPPYAHADDAERALGCALDLQAAVEAQELRLAIGVTTGRVFAGPVGCATRHEYTVMGDTVNLAARLMGVAGPGQVCCDFETYRRARTRLAFDLLPPTRVKGKAGLIRVYRPVGELGIPRVEERSGALIGRQSELAQLTAYLDNVQAGENCVLLIQGEAGIGKSRLVEELTRLMRERGLAGLRGEGRSVEQQTPYRAWRDVFVSYFGLEELTDPAERRRRVQDAVRDLAPELGERIPLLNPVLNLGWPDSELTASMDTQLRHESLGLGRSSSRC
jgi:class 3 adenylate cyclase